MTNFHKYHGAGNDFILINNLKGEINFDTEYIKFLCNRHLGVGADGLILLESSNKADCFMNYYNSDGTLAEMCGNGIRCSAQFYIEQTDAIITELNIDTRAGIKKITVNNDNTYSVNMGLPAFNGPDFPSGELNIEGLPFECVSMGNPHAVMIQDTLDSFDILTIGPEVENDYHFPNKINVEFVEKINDDYFKVRVWERGCGATLACGTGACAVYAVLKKKDDNLKEITLDFPGGKLYLSENEKGEIILRGPATFVFKGEI